jgi:hypothetical protein
MERIRPVSISPNPVPAHYRTFSVSAPAPPPLTMRWSASCRLGTRSAPQLHGFVTPLVSPAVASLSFRIATIRPHPSG